jgi:hypothetical protein
MVARTLPETAATASPQVSLVARHRRPDLPERALLTFLPLVRIGVVDKLGGRSTQGDRAGLVIWSPVRVQALVVAVGARCRTRSTRRSSAGSSRRRRNGRRNPHRRRSPRCGPRCMTGVALDRDRRVRRTACQVSNGSTPGLPGTAAPGTAKPGTELNEGPKLRTIEESGFGSGSELNS